MVLQKLEPLSKRREAGVDSVATVAARVESDEDERFVPAHGLVDEATAHGLGSDGVFVVGGRCGLVLTLIALGDNANVGRNLDGLVTDKLEVWVDNGTQAVVLSDAD